MLIVDEPAWLERRCSVISPSCLCQALVINSTYNMVPCRGRGRLLGSRGPLYLMRTPVPEDMRSTFTSRGIMTGYTINPRIGSTSTRSAAHVSTCACVAWLCTTRETCPTCTTTAWVPLNLSMKTSILEGRTHLTVPEMFVHIALDHMSGNS